MTEPEHVIDSVNVPTAADTSVMVPAEELADLRDEAKRLRALEAAGVDNWSGYDYAMQLHWEES